MRYDPAHKGEIHRKIVKDASRRVRAEGLSGAAVSAVMRGAGLTHGGFYKHFGSKDELLIAALSEAFRDISERLTHTAEHCRPATAWKAIVKAYLSPQHCDHPELGCPLAALGPELVRTHALTQSQLSRDLMEYKSRMLRYMPGRRTADKERNFILIFSTMIGALAIARLLPDRPARAKVLADTRDFLLRRF